MIFEKQWENLLLYLKKPGETIQTNLVYLGENKTLDSPPPMAPTTTLALENSLILSIMDKFSQKISWNPKDFTLAIFRYFYFLKCFFW